ncbi:MAG: histidine kinase [Chloroflexota bacterium]
MADTTASAEDLVASLAADIARLDNELGEITMLVGQARAEASRHEQKRVQATERIAAGDRRPEDQLEAYGQLVQLTRRAVLMEAQVEVLEGKLKALVRHRAAVAAVAERLAGVEIPEVVPLRHVAPVAETAIGIPIAGGEGIALPPGLSRVVLSAQEDLRREIARSMHDGPAQSLTNIVLQAQIVERLMERDPSHARGELRLLVSMVQQTLEATKNFIFDVRPMVLDDLGLVPTLRRSTRDRGRRSHVPVEFESIGQDRRLPVDVESATFRILDEALAAYLALGPERVLVRLEWDDVLEARVAAMRNAVLPADGPRGTPDADVPDALRWMMQDRRDARDAAVAAAEAAAIVSLPASARRDAIERAGSIGATVEFLAGGGELRLVVTPHGPDGEGGGRA